MDLRDTLLNSENEYAQRKAYDSYKRALPAHLRKKLERGPTAKQIKKGDKDPWKNY